MTEIKHKTTCVDIEGVGWRGTRASCICGWHDTWRITGGNAEASAADHMYKNDLETRLHVDTQYKIYEETRRLANEQLELDRIDRLANTLRGSENKPAPDHMHNCYCHLSAPCHFCVECRHYDNPECENDCQTCEEHEDA